jgi:DNA topoisomerase-1
MNKPSLHPYESDLIGRYGTVHPEEVAPHESHHFILRDGRITGPMHDIARSTTGRVMWRHETAAHGILSTHGVAAVDGHDARHKFMNKTGAMSLTTDHGEPTVAVQESATSAQQNTIKQLHAHLTSKDTGKDMNYSVEKAHYDHAMGFSEAHHVGRGLRGFLRDSSGQPHIIKSVLRADQLPKYEYASTQVNLPAPLARKIKSWVRQWVSKDILVDDGLEKNLHITVKYGITTDRPLAALRAALAPLGPVKARLGTIKVFDTNDGFDVLYLSVDSPDLVAANEAVRGAVSCDDTHPTYTPHITLAYVEKGKGYDVVGISPLSGEFVTFDVVTVSSKSGRQSSIRMTGEKMKEKPTVKKGIGMIAVALRKAHDVSQEKRDGDGKWTEGGAGQTGTAAFKTWFGDSKVVNDDGTPRICYHGTRDVFSEFSHVKQGSANGAGWYGRGFYFTPDESLAQTYALGESGHVKPLYISIKNPYHWHTDDERGLNQNDALASNEATARLLQQGHDGVMVYKPTSIKLPEGQHLSDAAVEAIGAKSKIMQIIGRDGLEARLREGMPYQDFVRSYGKEVSDLFPHEHTLTEIVAFTPEQVKSATGNNGSFDPHSTDITKSAAVAPAPTSSAHHPFLGVVLPGGAVSDYHAPAAPSGPPSHSLHFQDAGLTAFDNDKTLRYVKNMTRGHYELEGHPALHPDERVAHGQIKALAKHLSDHGVPHSTHLVCADHGFSRSTYPHQGKSLGTVGDYAGLMRKGLGGKWALLFKAAGEQRVPKGQAGGGRWTRLGLTESDTGATPQVEDAEKQIRLLRNEHLYAFNADGKRILKLRGQPDKVRVTPNQHKILLSHHGVILTHNHPSGWNYPDSDPHRKGHSFSPSDIKTALSDRLAEIRAVSPHYLYSLKPGESAWSESYYNSVSHILAAIDQHVKMQDAVRVKNGEISSEEADAQHWNTFLELAASDRGWQYARVPLTDSVIKRKPKDIDMEKSIPIKSAYEPYYGDNPFTNIDDNAPLDAIFDTPIYTDEMVRHYCDIQGVSWKGSCVDPDTPVKKSIRIAFLFKSILSGVVAGSPHPTMPHLAPTTPAERMAINGRGTGHKPVPPASWGMHVSPDHSAKVQATYHDAKGRAQYIYHKDHQEAASHAKYGKLQQFHDALPHIRAKVEADLHKPDASPDRVKAAVVHLMGQTAIRVGSEKYAQENGTFGASSLRKHHITVDHDAEGQSHAVHVSFPGKHGKATEKHVGGATFHAAVAHLMNQPGERVFQQRTRTGGLAPVTEKHINDYLHAIHPGIHAHQFRTHAATEMARAHLLSLPHTDDPKQREKNIRSAANHVSEHLNNTPAMALSSYIHPGVVHAYRQGALKSVGYGAD